MIPTFTNSTARSAGDLLADLQACRQLRHVTADQMRSVVRFFFGDIEHALLEGRALPNGRYFVWEQEAFEEALSLHGFSCDLCGAVEEVSESRWRAAAERLLENMDGKTKLCLCRICSSRFSTFCTKYFQREVRVLWTRELEQMMLAFVAHELGREAWRVIAGKPPRRRKDAFSYDRQDRDDREPVQGRGNSSASITLDWNPSQHGAEI